MTDDDPRQLGEYRLLLRLGEGGMGRVYLGRSPAGRTVAVKTVRAELAGSPGFRQRFAREVRASLAVRGPGTVPVLAADPDATVPWLASSYVAGPPLQEAVDGHGPLPVPALWRLLSGLAEALRTVHASGLVHRDLKPQNVLLSPDGPLLIDFGIARAVDETALTRTGFMIGSAGYMSPEHALGREVNGASDVFSLGVVLAFAATGRNPFGVGSDLDLRYRAVHEEPDLSEVPDGLLAVVRDCLAKEPGDRPSPGELLASAEEQVADAADWLPPSLASDMARRRETLRGTGLGDRATGLPPVADRPTATAVSRPHVPTRSSPPPPWQPPHTPSVPSSPSVPPVPSSMPAAAEVRIAPWVRRLVLGRPLFSLVGLVPMCALLVTGSDLKAQAREHPTTEEQGAWWTSLHHWAMDDDGWRVPLTVLLLVALVALQYLRPRLERCPPTVTRVWATATGAFWLLWSAMVPLTLFWVMGVADGAEEKLVSEGLRDLVYGTWWMLSANVLAVPFTAVAGVMRLMRGPLDQVVAGPPAGEARVSRG
ncbi:serine/threonine-protein kinase [Streptomyces sp. NPDC005820]|uniref:serine/threonine-protein kinase n=1 Tax=Streptomyces sp. NPDC005820 TaxID=3157069 RepID=UPI0033DBE12A